MLIEFWKELLFKHPFIWWSKGVICLVHLQQMLEGCTMWTVPNYISLRFDIRFIIGTFEIKYLSCTNYVEFDSKLWKFLEVRFVNCGKVFKSECGWVTGSKIMARLKISWHDMIFRSRYSIVPCMSFIVTQVRQIVIQFWQGLNTI